MAGVTVFADDAVNGSLPPLCVLDGTPTDGHLPVRVASGTGGTRLGMTWLLILLGPLGWVALGVITLVKHPAPAMVIQVPYADGARRRLVRFRRFEVVMVIAAAGLMVAEIAVLIVSPPGATATSLALVGVIAAAVAGTMFCLLRIAHLEVRARLDDSRRWIQLDNVDPAFAFAAWEQARTRGSDLPVGMAQLLPWVDRRPGDADGPGEAGTLWSADC